MKEFKDLINNLREENETSNRKRLNRRINGKGLTGPQFALLLKETCNLMLIERGENGSFVVDKSNKDILNQLYYYLTQDSRFNGSFDKGLLIIGKFGVGKTLIMRGFIEIAKIVAGKTITQFHSKNIASLMSANDEFLTKWRTKPIFIDDIGKESRSLKNFGSDVFPITDLFSARYDTGALTFATANHKLESFKDIYGGSIYDRMKSMFNVIHLEGETKR